MSWSPSCSSCGCFQNVSPMLLRCHVMPNMLQVIMPFSLSWFVLPALSFLYSTISHVVTLGTVWKQRTIGFSDDDNFLAQRRSLELVQELHSLRMIILLSVTVDLFLTVGWSTASRAELTDDDTSPSLTSMIIGWWCCEHRRLHNIHTDSQGHQYSSKCVYWQCSIGWDMP